MSILGCDARSPARPAARVDPAGRETASRRLHPRAGMGDGGRGTGVTTTGVVLVRTGSAYRVHTEGGEVVATLRGKLKHRDDDRVVAGGVGGVEREPRGGAAVRRRRAAP